MPLPRYDTANERLRKQSEEDAATEQAASPAPVTDMQSRASALAELRQSVLNGDRKVEPTDSPDLKLKRLQQLGAQTPNMLLEQLKKLASQTPLPGSGQAGRGPVR